MRVRYVFPVLFALLAGAWGLWACSFGPAVYNGPPPYPAPPEAGDDGDGIGRGERIGQHGDTNAAVRQFAHRLDAGFVRYEVGRNDQEILARVAHQFA